jgi:hypothetical protein
MAKITLNENQKPAWTKYVTIELSKREAALLRTIVGACNGRNKFIDDVHESLKHLPYHIINLIDLDNDEKLKSYLDQFGDE